MINMAPKSWQELLDELTSKAQSCGPRPRLSMGVNKCSKEEDILKALWTTELYSNTLSDWMSQMLNSSHAKSVSKAGKFRALGNERFHTGDNRGSLSLYNECVRYAPETSTELSLGLANRSASLFHMELYGESLQDINVAFLKGYPIPLGYKLRMRQSNCLIKLGKFSEAISALGLARTAVEQIEDTPKIKIDALRKEIDRVLADALQQLNVGDSSHSETASLQVAVSRGESVTLAHASAALDLAISKEKGRHVVTNTDLKLGDVLFMEKPYALVMLPEHYSKHCHHCCKVIVAFLPCCQCTEALYCADVCRQESWNQYHRWECHGLKLLHSIGIAHLGLRVVLKSGPISQLEDRVKALLNTDTAGTTGISREDTYAAVYHLMPHIDNMEYEDLFQYTLTAALLTLYLAKHTDYFKEHETFGSDANSCAKEPSGRMLFVGGLILRHIAQLVCNGHAITKLDSPDSVDSVVSEMQVRIATAIYPSASMMNHSCDPNIINSFDDQCLIVRASKDIPAGGEVFNCYGPHFRRMGLQERQEILSGQYFFKCTCKACQQSVDYDFQDRFNALLCLACEGPLVRMLRANDNPHELVCVDCGKSQRISCQVEEAFKACNLYKMACGDLEAGKTAEALRGFERCLQVRSSCLYRSHRDRTECADQMARCHATLGNYERAVECLLGCIPAVEEQFGADSVELANELQKLSDVMLCDLRQHRPGSPNYKGKHFALKECVNKAYQIMTNSYGTWNAGLQEMIAKKQHLEELPPE